MKLTLSTALMLVSGQITEKMRDCINSKDRAIREDVKLQHKLTNYFSTVNKVSDELKDYHAESVEVKEVTFSTCCQVVIAMLDKKWHDCYELCALNKEDGCMSLADMWIDACKRVSNLEEEMFTISEMEVK